MIKKNIYIINLLCQNKNNFLLFDLIMSGANQSNRPNTIDIQLINKNLSEKINAIKNTGNIEKISEEIKIMANNLTNQDLNTMKVGKDAEAMVEENSKKGGIGTSIFKICKKPVILILLYMLIHNRLFLKYVLNNIKGFNNIENMYLKQLIMASILTVLFIVLKSVV